MSYKAFSKDKNVFVTDIKSFFHKYLECPFFDKKDIWSEATKPIPYKSYLFLGKKYLGVIGFGGKRINFGQKEVEELENIVIAERNGTTEYELFDKSIQKLKEECLTAHKLIKNNLLKLVDRLEFFKRALPKNGVIHKNERHKFEDYLVDTGIKANNYDYRNRYIVIDVETNGLRAANDDLLSISIFDPMTGMCYNRFLPLDLQPMVLTGHINGITDDQLESLCHINQDEWNEVIKFFDLNNSVWLGYSGGIGTFDKKFILNYCKRHKLSGLSDDIKIGNIKTLIPKAPFGCEGELTKDNLCTLLGINGVEEKHSGLNDCILEWQLFEKAIDGLFFIQNHLYRFNKDYIIPISYLNAQPQLLNFIKEKPPFVLGFPKLVHSYEFPKTSLKNIKKFPTNITGMAVENIINYRLNVTKCNNMKFLINNKNKLDYIGSLKIDADEIDVFETDEGTFGTYDAEYEAYVNDVNNVTKAISIQMDSTISFIKEHIFKTGVVKSQELVVSNDRRFLALCDLSNDSSVVEIKTFSSIIKDVYGTHIDQNVSRQLYYESNGRKPYVLEVSFKTHLSKNLSHSIVDSLTINLFEVDLRTIEEKPRVFFLYENSKKVLKALLNDNTLSNNQIASMVGLTPRQVQVATWDLEWAHCIKRVGSKRDGVWIVLLDLKGNPVSDLNQKKKKSIDLSNTYIKNIKEKTSDSIEVLSYTTSREDAEYLCKLCGYKWAMNPKNFRDRKYKCPKCKSKRK